MFISAYIKTTLLDYPEHLAATVFTQGCNLRCPYCHNHSLLAGISQQEDNKYEELLSFLKKRAHLIEGICISGGEPTLQEDLTDFIIHLHTLGLKVKLDTNGTNPHILNSLLEKGLLDMVAMDLKNTPRLYSQTCGTSVSLDAINESIHILNDYHRSFNLQLEFRTTLLGEFHKPENIYAMAYWLRDTPNFSSHTPWFWQKYKFSENQHIPFRYTPIAKEALLPIQNDLKGILNIDYRGY